MLLMFKLKERLVPAVILSVLLASFVFSVVMTRSDPIGAFYLHFSRGWELALGALLAYREVFWLEALPLSVAAGGRRRRRARRRADALYVFGHERDRAVSRLASAIPTLGCALVIAHPHSLVGEVALGNRVAGFFGAVSYPLYLWHWPLFAFAHIWPGLIPTAPVLLALAGLAVCLAALTYRLIELPVRGGVSPPAVRDRVGSLEPARADRGRRAADVQCARFPLALPAAGCAHLRLRGEWRPGPAPDALLLWAQRGGAIRLKRGARERHVLSRTIIARRSKTRRSRQSSSSANRQRAHL